MRAVAIIPALLLIAACDRAAEVTFADTSIALPDDPIDLPDLPGRDAVIANCTACHSPSTMLQQPKVSREKWESQVKKMVEIYKAPIDPQAVPDIVDYMVAMQAQQANVSRETRTDGPPG
ncbi:MAG: cytochrome c [Rhizobiales bacterium]|nr:cytochrome c [Hyphomicrobiales bacterium]